MTSETPESELPSVAVVLAVRGAHPSLIDCLRRLLRQDYPDYDVHIVIDNKCDPAWDLLRPLVNDEGRGCVYRRALGKKDETCSLKVSALVQAIGALDDSFGVVALIDADLIPHNRWLRDLAVPPRDPRVGATTGVRWYLAQTPDWGSLVRCLWNAAAHPLHTEPLCADPTASIV